MFIQFLFYSEKFNKSNFLILLIPLSHSFIFSIESFRKNVSFSHKRYIKNIILLTFITEEKKRLKIYPS